ncbi:peptidase [Staphylococcus gallinarum]|uniref:Peptidase n=1 Tax=Staphylococcus gallinarum TaxID=1293 RepID=A0A380FN10_STAGA|nr:peptidase [Staphylococcus gallinarum]
MDNSVNLLKTLTDIDGIAGHEMEVKSTMKAYLTPVSDEIVEDNLGGIFAKKTATDGHKNINGRWSLR